MTDNLAEFTKEDQALSRRLVGKIGLNNIVMIQGSFSRGEVLDRDPKAEIAVNGGLEIKIETADDAMAALATMTVTATGTPTDPLLAGMQGFTVEGIFRANYSVLENDLSLDDRRRALKFILVVSAHQHLWPYWREFALQATNRMGTPPLIAPLLVMINPPMVESKPLQQKRKSTSAKKLEAKIPKRVKP